MAKTDQEFCALVAVTESNRPHEYPYIISVFRNRVEHPRFPDTYREVLMQPRQFSALNKWCSDRSSLKGQLQPDDVWRALFASRDQIEQTKLYPLALACAAQVLAAPRWQAPFDPSVCWYYSPVSMIPKGAVPTWAKDAAWSFTPPGVDPYRFVFCADVAVRKHS